MHRLGALNRLLTRLELFEDVDIGARNKRRARPNHHNGIDAVVFSCTLDSLADALRDTGTERVDRRIIDGDDGDTLADFVTNQL